MSIGELKSVSPTETLNIENGLSLVPRLKLHLTVYRSDLSVTPIDEWQLKCSLLDYLKTSLSIPEDDLNLHKFKDLKKRKREDPVASGVLYIRDLGFLNRNGFNKDKEEHKKEQDVKFLEKKFLEWRESFVEKLDGIELSIKGVKFKLNVNIPETDDYQVLKKSWDEFYAFSNKGDTYRGRKQQPDTIILRGLPSRWFSEPRVSSKPSMLVTHTIFSVFGKIRHLSVASEDDVDDNVEGAIVSGLKCKTIVQFQSHDEFCYALKLLCGRSMQKEGSRLRADYEATWDREDFFKNNNTLKQGNQIRYEDETPRYRAHYGRFDSNGRSDQPKRFKE